jgi:hypothetical protein
MLFRLFKLYRARVTALVIVLSDSLCERIRKWETCPILKEDRSLLRVNLEHLKQKTATLLDVSRAAVSKVISYTQIMGRHHQRRGTVSENQH